MGFSTLLTVEKLSSENSNFRRLYRRVIVTQLVALMMRMMKEDVDGDSDEDMSLSLSPVPSSHPQALLV